MSKNKHDAKAILPEPRSVKANSYPLNSSLKSGAFSCTRRTRALTGLNYAVWTSTDLLNWTQDAGEIQTPGIAVNQVETVAVVLSPRLLTSAKLFVRLRAAP